MEDILIDHGDDLNCLIDDFSTIDENEFWAVWNSNNEQNTKKRSEEETKTEEEDIGLALKRKQEVLSILSGYRNDIKKKKKQKLDSNEVDDSTFSVNNVVNEMKRKRLEAFDPVIAAFNVGDFEMMGEVLRDKCEDHVILSSQLLSNDSVGMKPLLLFWGLLHETYPDAMIQILETRLSSVTRASFHSSNKSATTVVDSNGNAANHNDSSNSSSSNGDSNTSKVDDQHPLASLLKGNYHSVEYVYKFTGTRITDRPVAQTFNKLIESGILNDDITHITNESLTSVISKYMTSADVPQASYVAHGCSYIIETVLTFNQHNKIIKWSYGILAAEIN